MVNCITKEIEAEIVEMLKRTHTIHEVLNTKCALRIWHTPHIDKPRKEIAATENAIQDKFCNAPYDIALDNLMYEMRFFCN